MNTLIDGVDYGPLFSLIGQWIGTKGVDVAPEPNGVERTSFIDELIISPSGPATNAEEQNLVSVRYRHIVRKEENGLVFHDQIGHWLYESATNLVMHSLTIPRGVCVLAGGTVSQQEGVTHFNVKAEAGSDTFGVIQSPFLLDKAATKAFEMTLTVKNNEMSYKETTALHIYGRDFSHVDKSTLKKVTYDLD